MSSSGGLSEEALKKAFDQLNKINQIYGGGKSQPASFFTQKSRVSTHYYAQFIAHSGIKPEKDKVTKRKFENGDHVEVVHKIDDIIPVGSVGEIAGYENGYYLVSFPTLMDDPQIAQHLHDGDGTSPTDSCRWARTEQIKLTTKPIKQVVEFDSVVTTDENRQQIIEILEQANQKDLIFETWGFGKTIEKGRGVLMLFYGPPGTGKTLMAQAIADKLDCKLRIVASADIESSQPGQTERNIRDIFKKVDKKTVLLFDECDSLIYDRSHVGAIMGAQVNELLSSLEKFEGVAVFTTNRLETLDEAVDRRLALKLEFAMPTQEQRVEIWKRMFPEECPLDANIDWDKLASIEIAGGHIKNAVLRAARMAAAEKIPDKDKKVMMKHLVKALQQEGKSMLAFRKAKESFNKPRLIGGPGAPIGIGSDRTLRVDTTMRDAMSQLGGSYD